MVCALESVSSEVMVNSGLDKEAIFNLVRCGERESGGAERNQDLLEQSSRATEREALICKS